MGYLSNVRITTSCEGYKELEAFVSKGSSEFIANLLEDGIPDIFEVGNNEVYFGWDSIKWYEQFDDIKLIVKGLNHLERLGYSYNFIRSGEEYGDIEKVDVGGDKEGYLYCPAIVFDDEYFREHFKYGKSCNVDHEDKQKIADSLCKTLQLTRGQYDLVSIKIEETPYGDEIAVATYQNGGTKKVYVTADSGMAMVADIVKGIF